MELLPKFAYKVGDDIKHDTVECTSQNNYRNGDSPCMGELFTDEKFEQPSDEPVHFVSPYWLEFLPFNSITAMRTINISIFVGCV